MLTVLLDKLPLFFNCADVNEMKGKVQLILLSIQQIILAIQLILFTGLQPLKQILSKEGMLTYFTRAF